MIVLYHGTDEKSAKAILNNGIDVHAGNTHADFGQGFYLTPCLRTASQWAVRKGILTRGAIVSYQFHEDSSTQPLKCKRFYNADYEWAQFVANNRNGWNYTRKMKYSENNLREQYDIVIGQIADGKVSSITRFLKYENAPVDQTVLDDFKRKNYSLQYSFHTLAAVSTLSGGRMRLL